MDMLTPTEPTALAAAFDYSTLAPDIAERARQRAARIVGIYRRTVEAAGEIGRELLAAQAELDHGERGAFLRWVEAELGFGKSSAYRFMDVARSFGEKLPTVGNLPPAVVYKLAASSTPEPVRAAVLRRIEAGETVKADAIVEEIREAKDEAAKRAKAEREEARRAALTPEAREEEDALNARGAKGREARERKAERERERMNQERRAREDFEQSEAAAASRLLLDGLGPEVAASFCARFEANYGAALRALMKLAQVERARGVEADEIDMSEISLMGVYGDLGSAHWPDEAEVKALAEEIERDGLQEPIVLMGQSEVGRQSRNRYLVVDGSRRYRAVRNILGWEHITARIAPPIEPLPDPDA